jgi:hypothetical protein
VGQAQGTVAVILLRVVDVFEATLAVCLADVAEVPEREHQRQDRDASAVHPNLGIPQLSKQLDPTTARGTRPGPILDPAPADAAQVIVIDVRAVRHQQLDHAVVDVEPDLDVSGLDPRQEQIE